MTTIWSRFVRWVNPRGRERSAVFWRVALFYNPVICSVFAAVFNKYDGLSGYLVDLGVSITIGTVAIVVALLTGALAETGENYFRSRRGLGQKEHGLGWHLIVAGSGLPVGVFLGLHLAGWLFGFGPPGFRGMGLGVVTGVLVMVSFFLFETVGDLREAKTLIALREQEAQNARLRGELLALTAQMNPHFLFNTLNTIASLTQSDADSAEKTTVELAGLYRGVLEAARKEQQVIRRKPRCRPHAS